MTHDDSSARSATLDDRARSGLRADSPRATTSLRTRRAPLAPSEAQRQILAQMVVRRADGRPAPDFGAMLAEHDVALDLAALEVFQINLGKLCNMTCRHCHVDAGPDRTDAVMTRETIDDCLRALDQTSAHTVDLTGGAPELNPHFRYLVDETVARGKHVIDRCNLTLLLLKRFEDLPQWFAERGVEVVCSLPHYRRRNTDAQRGSGTFEKSIEALRRLNAAGYGQGDPGRRLTLMSNPAGAFLSGSQATMEAEWKAGLAQHHGVRFDRLFTLNNMPISRFLDWLLESGNLGAYMERLVNAFNPGAVGGLMCRNTLSVSWDGRLFDCDFNQMLEMEAELAAPRVSDFDLGRWMARRICTGRHCYGCTAGAGSSCAGATS